MNSQQLIDFATKLQAAGMNVFIGINVPVSIDLDPDPQDPPPDDDTQDPPPPFKPAYIQVSASRAVARFIAGQNAAGAPIFEIFPSETSAAADRVIFQNGTVLPAYPTKVKGDGGAAFWHLHDPDNEYADELYLRSADVVTVVI